MARGKGLKPDGLLLGAASDAGTCSDGCSWARGQTTVDGCAARTGGECAMGKHISSSALGRRSSCPARQPASPHCRDYDITDHDKHHACCPSTSLGPSAEPRQRARITELPISCFCAQASNTWRDNLGATTKASPCRIARGFYR